MHQGQITASQTPHGVPQYSPPQAPPGTTTQLPQPPSLPAPFAGDESLDDLIKGARDQADAQAAAAGSVTATSAPAVPTPPVAAPPVKEEAAEDKATKKDKEKEKPKSTRLVYSDNETSPEEKMAMMPKYAFTPAQKNIMV